MALGSAKNTPLSSFCTEMQQFVETLQDDICKGLEQFETSARFQESLWAPSEKFGATGGGRSRVLQHGQVIEKGAVHSSAIQGILPESMAQKFKVETQAYFATGVSLIIHPLNPYVPTVHANYRYFELGNGDFWFGGGTDLTPYYAFLEDVKHFHTVYKRVCDRHSSEYYRDFKKWCDEYFFLPHRDETRGVGGIFFDYQRGNRSKLFAFVQDAGKAFLESYIPIVLKRKDMHYGELQKWWHAVRRGRYVEFNLLYDRGTKFGLESGGRTESILASLPPLVRWEYELSVQTGSEEQKLLDFLKPRDWLV